MDERRTNALMRLLSGRDRLSPPEKEAIFEAVIDSLGRPARKAARARWFALGIGVALTLALVIAIRPGKPTLPGDLAVAEDGDTLVARGADDVGPQLTVLCGDRPLVGGCSRGNLLGFEVAGMGEHRYVAMFATRPDGAVIWYTPSATDAATPALAIDGDLALVPQRVELGPEHVPGRYGITAVFSPESLTRADAKAVVQGERRPGVTIVEREMVVQ